MSLYNSIDVALDPFPYNGTTTTCEALWMGVPTVTMVGDRHAGRVGASILTHAGFENFIANDPESYLRLAIELANDTSYRAALKNKIRKTMKQSKLCNAKKFTSRVEDAYKNMWDNSQHQYN